MILSKITREFEHFASSMPPLQPPTTTTDGFGGLAKPVGLIGLGLGLISQLSKG